MGTEPPNASRAAADQGRVTGVQNGGTSGFLRLEIDDFCQYWPRLNLYLLAMEQIQDNRSTTRNIHTDWWCWWQIQGIHGKPWAQWRGIGPTALYSALSASGVSRVRNKAFTTPEPTAGDRAKGYCTHGSVLFPTWHRAYEAMIEQALQATMCEIAAQFPMVEGPAADRALVRLGRHSRAAATAFRQPYWDPFRARAGTAAQGNLVPGLSLILAVKQVSVTRPTGVKETIDNPLYCYKYPDRSLFDTEPRPIRPNPIFVIPVNDQWAGHDKRLRQTCRWPPEADGSRSRNISIQRGLETVGTRSQLIRDQGTTIHVAWWRDLMEKAFHTLMIDLAPTHQTDQSPGAYHRFATTEWHVAELSAAKGTPVPTRRDGRTDREPLSLENWHDWIHFFTGGGGTMSDPQEAGHDPIFIFHHSNIDRHFALYQALHPDIWFGADGMAATADSFTSRSDTIENPETPLMPFVIPYPTEYPPPSHPYWTSNGLRNHQVLGYEYEPIHSSLDRDARKQSAIAEVNRTLNWWSTGTSSDSSLNPISMDKVQAFVIQPGQQQPLIDDLTTETSLWTVPPPVASPSPSPGPAPAPPAGPGPMPLREVALLSHRQTAGKTTKFRPGDANGPSSVAEEATPEHRAHSSAESPALTPPEAPSPPSAGEPPHTTLPDSDYKYIFPPHTIEPSGRVPLWFFNFRAERHCLGGSFTVHVFLGDFGPDHTGWLTDEENALAPLFQFVSHNPDAFESVDVTDDEGGDEDDDEPATEPNANADAQPDSVHTHHQLPRPKRTKRTIIRLKPPTARSPNSTCANCAAQETSGAHLAGAAPLTQNLIRYIHHGRPVPEREAHAPLREGDQLPPVALASLAREDVVPFLLRNLHWRIVRVDGTRVPRAEMPSFKAFVTRRYMTLPKRQSDWPVYEAAELIWEVTHGRQGGLEDGVHP